ncbi:MAG TPA: YdcF family protein [Pseudorhodoplanes sp.]|jgi:uncharacterized SAM-binding protein YcdF (DUF218 family)|nr:YdcF family protein [Pseudorhodoplanes sp.]
MFFALSKIAGFLGQPSNLLVLLLGAGLVLSAAGRARAGRAAAVLAAAGLALFGLSPLGNWLIYPLEQRFPPFDPARGSPDGIIILGGSIAPDVSAAHRQPALNESAERLTVAATLARAYPAARIVFTGGNGDLWPSGRSEAEFALPLLQSFGIAPERILLESRSRATAENAAFTRDLVRPKPGERWLLVTSAYHMPRAVGVFRKAGFSVEAYPVDWRVGDNPMQPFQAVSEGLRRTDTAMREWIGLIGYRIGGRSDELLPGPR